MMLRCFIAIKIEPSQPLRRILRTLGEMGRSVRAVEVDALHVTLRFLGPTDDAVIPEIEGAIQTAVAPEPPFTLHVATLGAFPHARRPSVIWAGLEECPILRRVTSRLNDALDALGVQKDDRPWHAHLTLARVKSAPPAELRDLLESQAVMPLATQMVDSVELLRSDLTPNGPRYTVVASAVMSKQGLER